ncbi:recombinase RecX [Echinicola pacifica]|uniref:Regulatory protein RecX n=2 Tax=Echinicola pacifica TaxID=346377 RepID=A0A918ULY9_9BACT|nr:RecX family transcriptional regulator [Echinicola pacifica]GGZ19519.1 recombinase RecX [Echinicola pacifica]
MSPSEFVLERDELLKLHKMSFLRKDYSQDPQKKNLSPSQAKVKIAAFCAYQERSQQEVRDKLYTYGLHRDEVEELISVMITENFLNEERFAETYVRGKFNLKKWGKIKILQGLKQHRLSANCVKAGMKQISEEAYWDTLLGLASAKWNSLAEPDAFRKKIKVQRFLLSRGYENDLIYMALQEVEEDHQG